MVGVPNVESASSLALDDRGPGSLLDWSGFRGIQQHSTGFSSIQQDSAAFSEVCVSIER
jgi:hypothetical protein